MASIEVYDPAVGTWEIYAGLTVPRSGVKACVLADKIYVLGGFDGSTRYIDKYYVYLAILFKK